MGERTRKFTAVVWPEGGRQPERVAIRAGSRDDAAELLRETYGPGCDFDLVDVEAATRPR